MSFKSFSFPQGAITEISGAHGSGKTEALLRFLSDHPALRVAWIEQAFSVYPCRFPQMQVGLDRVFFIDVTHADEKLSLWAAHQALSSQLFGIVVLNFSIREAVPLRRLQLAAGKNGAFVVLLSERPMSGASWPIHLQLQATRNPEDEEVCLSVLRNKGERKWRPQIA